MLKPLGRWTACTLLAWAACVRESSSTAPPRDARPVPLGTAAPAATDKTSAQAVGTAEASEETAVVLSAALVRRQPTEARFVSSPGKKGRQGNVVATLYRGEAVQVRARRDHFVDVTLSDESHGWVKEDGILVASSLHLATVLEPSRLFTRPDLLALQGNRTVAPGTLLIVLRHKDQFSLVNYTGSQSAWVLSALLQSDADEVGAAKLVHRARLMQEREDAGAEGVIGLLRGQFGSTRLFAALEAAQARAVAAGTSVLPAAENDSANVAGGSPGGPAVSATPSGADAPAPVAPSLRLTPAPATPAPPAVTGGAPGLQGWQPPTAPPAQDDGENSSAPAPLPPGDGGIGDGFVTPPDDGDF